MEYIRPILIESIADRTVLKTPVRCIAPIATEGDCVIDTGNPRVDSLADRVSDRAYERLRQMIVSLELAPGSQVVEAQLMVRLGSGRTPLREALQRLKDDGLIVALPRRSMSVAEITVDGLKQIYQARSILEPAIGRLAAEEIAPEQLTFLGQIVDRHLALAEATPYEITECDMAFHRSIAEASGNRYLVAAFDRIRSLAQRLSVLAYSRAPVVPSTIEEHRRIVEALRVHDADCVAQSLDAHIRNAKDRILKTV